MCKREPKEAKSSVSLVGVEMWSPWQLGLLGHFLGRTLMLVSSEFSLNLIRLPRKTELLPDGYMLGCWHSGSQAWGEKARESQHSLCMFSLLRMLFLMSMGYNLLPLIDLLLCPLQRMDFWSLVEIQKEQTFSYLEWRGRSGVLTAS